MQNKKWCVYCHTLLKDGRKYVGITSNKPKSRWHRGLGYVNNTYFYNAINKYGWEAFEHKIMYSNLSKEEAEEIEMKLIKEWQTQDKRKGFNIREGGNVSLNSEETRKKISIANKGKKISEEAKKKISIANSGKNNGNYGKKYTKEERKRFGKKGKEHWCYGKRLPKETRLKISTSLNGLLVGSKNGKSKKIIQKDTMGNVINTFESMNIASKETSVNINSICACCNKRYKSAGGYVWELYE